MQSRAALHLLPQAAMEQNLEEDETNGNTDKTMSMKSLG